MMMRPVLRTLGQSIAIVGASAVLAIITNFVRADGIPLVTDVPYEIFAPCKDSEAVSDAFDFEDHPAPSPKNVLYVDARPAESFLREHAAGAVNVPYSALFGAADEDIARVRDALQSGRFDAVLVYGRYDDPDVPGQQIDFARPLAQQLVESGVANTRHVEDGLEELKKRGVAMVEGQGGEQ